MSSSLQHGRFDLAGKVAFITGGAGLLGTQHGAALAEVGAQVILADIDLERAQNQAERLGREFSESVFSALQIDVTSPHSVRKACEDAIAQHGQIDILINNAAIDPKVTADSVIETSRVENFPLDQWQFQIDVGLTGAFLCSQAFGSRMAERRQGVILNIASDLSVFAPDQRIYEREGVPTERQPVKPITYSIVKTALVGMTRYLATYWATNNVRVNALSPGGVYNNQSEAFVVRLCNLIPMSRMARADEYRAAVQFLCSDASSYMTGQNIVMDGGRSVW